MRFLKLSRCLAVAVASIVAAQMLVSMPTPALAGGGGGGMTTVVTEVVGGGGGSSSGGWIVGGVFISVASIIACAMIVGAEEDREMTLEEALLSGAIPLGCLLREELGVSPE